MAKLSRSAFLYSLGATSALLLAGCGSGTTKNTPYGGAYSSSYTIAQTGETGFFNFTVDIKGNITGSLDNQGGKVREVSGTLKSDGSFTADTFDRGANVRGQLSGIMSGGASVLAPGALPTATPITGGNFTLTEGTAKTTGSFLVGGTPPASGTSGYQGSYSGVYNIPGLSQNGTISFTVDTAGNMTGLFGRGNETGNLTGSIASTGNLTATVVFATQTVALKGTLSRTTDGSTQGNFNLVQDGTTYGGTFGKSAIPPTAGNSAYAGSYRGTYGIPEQGENGNASLTVDPSGAFTGFLSQSNNSAVGTFTGAFNNDGRFTGSVTYDPSAGIPDRPITGRLGKSTVAGGGQAGDFLITIGGSPKAGSFELSVGGAESNSNYRAAYSDAGFFTPAFTVNGAPAGTINPSDTSEFSVDKEGSIIGQFGAYAVRGRIGNDARIVGTIRGENDVPYAFRGAINKLTWTFRIITQVGGLTTELKRPGIKGDIIVTINGKEYGGFIKSTGGDGVTI